MFIGNRFLFVLLPLLIVVTLSPLPTILSYCSTKSKLEDSNNKLDMLVNRKSDLDQKKRVMKCERETTKHILKTKFEGINSALVLRNMVAKFAGGCAIESQSCVFTNIKQLTGSGGGTAIGRKDLFSTQIEMKGNAVIEDLFLFITLLERIDIGLQVTAFSVMESREKRGLSAFTLSLQGYFVADVRNQRREGMERGGP